MILDPFKGSGSTIAAASACGLSSLGLAIHSHYDHPGWYIVWRYLVDRTESIEAHKPIIFRRVDVVFLEKHDWKYERSSAGDAGGGRTHTFGVKQAAKKLRGTAVYQRKAMIIRDGKPIPRNGD
jgi:hypothetical protein